MLRSPSTVDALQKHRDLQTVARKGVLINASVLPSFVANDGGRPVGLLTHDMATLGASLSPSSARRRVGGSAGSRWTPRIKLAKSTTPGLALIFVPTGTQRMVRVQHRVHPFQHVPRV